MTDDPGFGRGSNVGTDDGPGERLPGPLSRAAPADVRSLLRWARATVIALGLIRALASRNASNPAGIAYLDIADAYRRGDLANAVNAYWSPLYSWLLALTTLALRPSPYWEAAAAHLLNFLIYIGALLAFERFLGAVMDSARDEPGALPDWCWIAIGYPLFAWSALVFITVSDLSADLLASAFMYGAAALLVRHLRRPWSAAEAMGVGAALGAAYLSKAGMFPLSIVWLVLALACRREPRRNIRGVALAALVFAVVSAPFIAAMSIQKRRATYGDAGTLVYAWFVSGVPRYAHWQGESPGRGVPAHPDRKLHEHPAVYEYATPVSGTHPIWYDPTYWHEGLETRVDARKQARALRTATRIYFEMFVKSQAEILGLILLLGLSAGARRRRLVGSLPLLVAAAAAFAMFALVHVEPRFVGGFLVILLLGSVSIVQLPDDPSRRRLASMIAVSVAALIAVRLVVSTAGDFVSRDYGRPHPQYAIARALEQQGLAAGARVATIGPAFSSYWARLARARIVAEVPAGEEDEFWSASPEVRRDVLDIFRAAGVTVIVATSVPQSSAAQGWKPLAEGEAWTLFLDQSPRQR